MPGQTPSVRSLGGEGLKVMLSWRAHFAVSPQAVTEERLFFVGRDTAGQRPIGKAFFYEQQRAGAGRSAPAQGSSSNGRGQDIICLPFARALPAFSNSPAASPKGCSFCKAHGPKYAHAATLVQQSRAGLCSAMGADAQARELM